MDYALRVHTMPHSRGDKYRLDKGALQWLWRDIAIGDVVYDIDCGVGAYGMLAAKYHGAVVVAFEPGFAAFKALCDNLHLNACDGSVMPISLALADFEGMGELKYPSGLPAGAVIRSSCGLEGEALERRRGQRQASGLRDAARPGRLTLRSFRRRIICISTTRIRSSMCSQARHACSTRSVSRRSCLRWPPTAGELLAARLATQKWYVTRHTPMTRGRAHVVLSRARAPPTGRRRGELRDAARVHALALIGALCVGIFVVLVALPLQRSRSARLPV